MGEDGWWLLVGFGGQLLFMGRFVLQWFVSERQRRSVIPVSFWYLSIAGALVLLAYAIHRQDTVFTAGQGLGVAIYLRNLHLIRAERARRAAGRAKTSRRASAARRPHVLSYRHVRSGLHARPRAGTLRHTEARRHVPAGAPVRMAAGASAPAAMRLTRARTADSGGSGNTTPSSGRRWRPGTGCGR